MGSEGSRLAESERGVWVSWKMHGICAPRFNRKFELNSLPGAENRFCPQILEPRFGYPLITPHGWLLTALLHVAPGSPSSPGFRLDEFVFDIPVPVRGHPHRNRGKETSFNHTIGAVRSLGPGAASSSSSSASASRGVLLQYLVLNYSPNSTEHTRRRFRIEVSAADVAAVLGGHVAAGGGCGALAVTQQAMNRTTACPENPSPSPYFVPGVPHAIHIESRQALISYQDHHMLLLTLSGHA